MKVRNETQNKILNNNAKLLTAEDEIALAKEVAAGNKAAKDKMVTANLRLVDSVANKHRNRGVDFDDLVVEGSIGLMTAVEKFDWRMGNKFSTYATWWIRQGITRAIEKEGRTVRLPAHISARLNRINKESEQLQQKLGRNPTDEEIAESLGWTAKAVRSIKERPQNSVSFETPVGGEDEGDESLFDFTQDKTVPSPFDAAVSTLLREELRAVLSTLPARERIVLEMRYGLIDGCPQTLDVVGKRVGLSRERVRQIETAGMRHLRHPKRCQRLQAYL